MKTLTLILFLFSCSPADDIQAYWEPFVITEIRKIWRDGVEKWAVTYQNEHGLTYLVFVEGPGGKAKGDTVYLLTKR